MKHPLRIIIVDPQGLTPFYDQYYCTALAERGLQIDLWTREPDFLPGYFDNRKFRIQRLARISKAILPGNSLVTRFLKYSELLMLDFPRMMSTAFRGDVIHVQWLSPHPIASIELFFWKILKLLGKPAVFTAHNVFPPGGNHTVTRHLRSIYAIFDRVILTSEYGKKLFEKHFPKFSSKAVKIPHGPFFHDKEKTSQVQARMHLGLPASRPMVLFQGFFKAHKGVEFLLEAFPQVLVRHPDALLLLVGGGDVAYRKKISARLQQLLIPSNNVSARSDLLPVSELLLYYHAADIVVFPYKDIYQSGALFTALALRKAVIATTVGGLPEVIKDGVNGRLVDYGDVDTLANIINELVEHPEKRKRFGKESYKTATVKFSWKMIAERSEEVYRQFVN